MSTYKRDLVLPAAEFLIWLALGVIAFAGVIVVVCIPGVMIFGGEFVEAAETGLTIGQRALVALLLAGVAGLLYLGWRFFRAMQAIVRSVGYGDPFVSANADRLTEMAWIALAVHVVAIPVAGLGLYIARLAGEQPGKIEAGFDFGGILLILTLFILARVFRKGTEMREDLEGTI